jgi:hypothetical protein
MWPATFVINVSYAELIKHYGTAVVPARVRRPKDKPAAENGVLQAYRWLLAPLRNHQFFSLAELNEKLAKLGAQLNDKPMAGPRDGSRRSLFEAVERAALKALPSEPYVLGEWTIGFTVNVDYHIALKLLFGAVSVRAQGRRRFRDTDRRANLPSWRARRQPCPRHGAKLLDHHRRAHAPGA